MLCRMARITLERHKHPDFPRLTVLLHDRSRFYQALTFLDGRKAQTSLNTDQLPLALRLAEDWYRKLLRASVLDARRHPIDRLTHSPTVADVFASYRRTLPPSKRDYADMKWGPMADFWQTLTVDSITTQTFRDFYAWRRRRRTRSHTVLKNHTLHKNMMVIRQVLKFAVEDGHLTALPAIPKVGRIDVNPRPWLTRDEWDQLLAASERRIAAAGLNPKLKRQRQDLHDFMLFMLESMMRVSEVRSLTVGQCKLMENQKDLYLLINVHGKTGHRTVVAGGHAPFIYDRRAEGRKPGDKLWAHGQRDAFQSLLTAAKLRADEFGQTRNLKSIRATAISFRILQQAPSPNLLLIARNAGTSVTMIDRFYAQRLSAEMGAAQLSVSTV
jgi:hypothetical protein